jgi:secondary thiamine-phosphate synthase enzyme
MKFIQRELALPAFPRGFHLITRLIEKAIPELREISIGQLQVFIKHTSASLSINENADPTVRVDFETHFNKMIPENAPYYKHDTEGPDDMPAHIKSSLLGSSVLIPITNGELNLGIWQGIYLCEHRNHGGKRNLVLTAFGSASANL